MGQWRDAGRVMNVNAIFDRVSTTCGSINQSINQLERREYFCFVLKKKRGKRDGKIIINKFTSTHHIDKVLEGDGRCSIFWCATGSVAVVTTAAALVVLFLVVVQLLLQVKFLLQLLDLVRLNMLTKFRRPQCPAEILPRNLSETFRIELQTTNEFWLLLLLFNTPSHTHTETQWWWEMANDPRRTKRKKKKSFLLMNVSDLSSSIPTQYTGTPCGNACFFFFRPQKHKSYPAYVCFSYITCFKRCPFSFLFFSRAPPPLSNDNLQTAPVTRCWTR